MKTVTKIQTGKAIPKELELELVGEKLIEMQADSKRRGLKFETHEEVKRRYGFK